MKAWPLIRLGDICSPVNRSEAPIAGRTYRQTGVRLWGVGAYERETIDGGDTKYSYFTKLQENDLVVNKIWACNGSVAVIPAELAGTYVSTEFPTFQLDQRRIDPRWMELLTKWKGFWAASGAKAQGSSGKSRIKPAEFLGINIPLPEMTVQHEVVHRFTALTHKSRQVLAHLDAIESDADKLLAIKFRQHTADTSYKPIGDVAPVIRREQEINIEGSYPELGIRSFGKGTFHKPPLAGGEVGSKRLYRIEPNDLLFSNVFAWEGAIAVAQKEDAGRFGSHRFITCVAKEGVVTPSFLRYYFLTKEGLDKINKASPGGAGRNRTLGLEKLMAIQVPVPELHKQYAFDKLQAKVAELKARHNAIRATNAALVPAMLERIFR